MLGSVKWCFYWTIQNTLTLIEYKTNSVLLGLQEQCYKFNYKGFSLFIKDFSEKGEVNIRCLREDVIHRPRALNLGFTFYYPEAGQLQGRHKPGPHGDVQ